MAASISLDDSVDVRPAVTFYPELGEQRESRVVIRIGRGSLHLDPDTARQLATDILAALPCPDCALGACTADHGGAE